MKPSPTQLRRFLFCSIAAVIPAITWAFLSKDSVGQPAQKTPPTTFECRFTDQAIKITGKGDDPAWKHAQTIDHFYLPWLGDKARPAKTKTRAKLLWDREYLYFFADMEDTDLYADVKEHDGMTWNNDVFELFFKPADDKPGYYEFQVNAAGTVMDMFLPRRGAGGYQRFIKDGDFHIDAKVHLRGTLNKWQDKDLGWSVEGRIPWTDFMRTGGRPNPGEKWKFALCRYDYSVDFEGPELSTCAPLKGRGIPDFHHFEEYATLEFGGPKAPGSAGLTRPIPMTTSRVIGSPDPPPPYRIKKIYPDLPLNWPEIVTPQPGSDRMVLVALDGPYSQTRIYRFSDDPAAKELETLLTLTDTAYQVEFHPQFAKNGYFYVGSNGAAKPGAPKKTRVTRYTMATTAPYNLVPNSAQVVIEWDSDGHNGGAMAFGHDGMLYVTSGDGTSDSDTNIAGQEMSKLLAKVLRIDVDHPEPGKQYSVPKDNPFIDLRGARPETWAFGLRNPWRMTVDAKTGHLWVGQNGQDLWEQAYLVKKGENYGWSIMEGSHPFYPKRKLGPTPLVAPTVEHPHSEARSLTGGIVYYGQKHPELQGAYIYGDYSTGKVWAVKHDGKQVVWHKEIADTRLSITGFGVDQKGEILICDFRRKGDGGIYTLESTPRDSAASTFPRKLSDSGLFKSVKGHVMEPSLIPYSVNAVLWSDGAAKERWLGIPPGGKIDFTTSRGWNLPDRTVIVKSFHVDLEEGNPGSRRWIETRFLTRQGGEWFGYSYAWDDAETDGTLVDAKGMDRDFTIRVPKSAEHPDGTRQLKWRYPSRTECMVCHSRAANWVLGLTELQMNKPHNYGGVVENQLHVFERLGLLEVNWAAEARDRLRDALKAKGMSEKDANAAIDRQSATRGQREPVTSSLLTAAPEKLRKLVDPHDRTQDINLRARSYLHSNCAQCHVEAGGGNAQMELEFTTPLEKTRLINTKPQHDTFGLKNAALVRPGHPESSVLLQRIAHRDKGHMPPLATRVVDEDAVRLIREWIRQMKTPAQER